jgi:hypothetical protein
MFTAVVVTLETSIEHDKTTFPGLFGREQIDVGV